MSVKTTSTSTSSSSAAAAATAAARYVCFWLRKDNNTKKKGTIEVRERKEVGGKAVKY